MIHFYYFLFLQLFPLFVSLFLSCCSFQFNLSIMRQSWSDLTVLSLIKSGLLSYLFTLVVEEGILQFCSDLTVLLFINNILFCFALLRSYKGKASVGEVFETSIIYNFSNMECTEMPSYFLNPFSHFDHIAQIYWGTGEGYSLHSPSAPIVADENIPWFLVSSNISNPRTPSIP